LVGYLGKALAILSGLFFGRAHGSTTPPQGVVSYIEANLEKQTILWNKFCLSSSY